MLFEKIRSAELFPVVRADVYEEPAFPIIEKVAYDELFVELRVQLLRTIRDAALHACILATTLTETSRSSASVTRR